MQLAKQITRMIDLVFELRPFLECMASHPEHEPPASGLSVTAGELLAVLDEYLEWETAFERELESKPQ